MAKKHSLVFYRCDDGGKFQRYAPKATEGAESKFSGTVFLFSSDDWPGGFPPAIKVSIRETKAESSPEEKPSKLPLYVIDGIPTVVCNGETYEFRKSAGHSLWLSRRPLKSLDLDKVGDWNKYPKAKARLLLASAQIFGSKRYSLE